MTVHYRLVLLTMHNHCTSSSTFHPESVSYDSILQVVLVSLNRADLYSTDVPKPRGMRGAAAGHYSQPSVGSLRLLEMEEEMCGAVRSGRGPWALG